MSRTITALAEDLHECLDNDLRVVARYDSEDWSLVYARDDITESYTEDQLDVIFDDLILQGLGTTFLEDIFHAGRLTGTALCFEEAVILHFRLDNESGLAISVDPGRQIDLPELVNRCRRMASKHFETVRVESS